MTSERSYKKPLSKDEAVAILREESGKQFDPKLALIFIELVEGEKVEIRGQKAAVTGDNIDGQMSLM